MVNENLIPKTETVYELNNETPTLAEFMKTYQGDDKVNASYENEINSYDGLGAEKGYGPCSSYYCSHSRSELQDEIRCLKAQITGELRSLKDKIETHHSQIKRVEWFEEQRDTGLRISNSIPVLGFVSHSIIDAVSSSDISEAKSKVSQTKSDIISTINTLIERHSN